jgi:tRNA(Ile)-lysidine synthase
LASDSVKLLVPVSPYYVVAVSGGVDSVVLLDMLVRRYPQSLIVAHVDHGIRPESSEDARFVKGLAAQYHLPYVTTELHLGTQASEDAARTGRYEFLFRVSRQYQDAPIITAHHADDVIETIALNLERGTGWRGLAVLQRERICRPLLTHRKQDLIDHALREQLEWCEDATNRSSQYQRNRIRKKSPRLLASAKQQLLALWQQQCEVRREIDDELAALSTSQRYPYIMLPTSVATELAHYWLTQQGVRLTRPQQERWLMAIRTAKPGTQYTLGVQCRAIFSARDFQLQTSEE